jgi:YesN/AraC family two-component response regulator
MNPGRSRGKMHVQLAILGTESQQVESVTTVVVVDDDPDYLWVVRFILESGSANTAIVGEAASGEEALALVLRKCPDVVIADLMMPQLNGLDLTRRIKEERPQTKILLISAYTEDTYRRIASVSGADGFLNKHLIHTGLLPAIREVIVRPPSILYEPPPSSSPPA